MVLEGYVDDSGSSDGNVFVLAGYLSTADEWAGFSEEWKRICDQDPKTPDFKMSKTFQLREYKWTEAQRDKRISELASLISQKTEYRVDAMVAWEDYRWIVRGKLRREIDSPYFILFYHVMLSVAHFMDLAGIEGTVNWVFDEQGLIGKKSRAWYYEIKNLAPAALQQRLGGEPIFQHDTQLPPLKAADMLAWHIHRHRNREQSHPVQYNQSMTSLLSMPGSSCNIYAEDLVRLVESINENPMLQAHCGFFLPPDDHA